MGNGEWGMGNGEWGMGNGEWGIALEPGAGNGGSGIVKAESGEGVARRASLHLFPIPHSRFPAFQAIALSMSWVSWDLLTAPIWVASTLPFLKIIRVGMPRTL